MTRLSLAIILSLLSFKLFAQPNQGAQSNLWADSLKRGFETATTDKGRIFYLGQLAQLTVGIDKKKSDEYTAQMYQIAELSSGR